MEHAPITEIYTYPDSLKLYRLKTEDDYIIDVTGDTDVLTIDGWKKVESITLDDVIM